jgi:hypothetical protein
MVEGCLTSPGDESIGAHEHSAQAHPILGVTGDIGDPTTPAACEGLKRFPIVNVQ